MEGACIIQKSTLTQMVTDQLRQDILLGIIASGSRITVQSIAKRYNTSALPVREAMQILSSENLLELSPYKGASVCEINHTFISNTYDILRSMEVLIVESCLPHWSNEIRAQIVAANDEIHRLDSYEAVIERFNRRYGTAQQLSSNHYDSCGQEPAAPAGTHPPCGLRA